ncbi:MAG: rhodanese-like domain-containing protein [Clostridia bacterium]
MIQKNNVLATEFLSGFLVCTDKKCLYIENAKDERTIDINMPVLSVKIINDVAYLLCENSEIYKIDNLLNLQIVNFFDKHIFCDIAFCRDKFYFLSTMGELLYTKDFFGFEKIKTENKIVGFATNGKILVCICGNSYVYTIENKKIKILNHNEYYKKKNIFKKIYHFEYSFYVISENEYGKSEILTSLAGGVWQKMYSDNFEISDYKINDLAFDNGQIFAVCENGEMLVLTDCVKCNKVNFISEKPIKQIFCNDLNTLFIFGDNSYFIKENSLLRLYNLSEELFLKKKEKSVIIDVRTKEEYEKSHIKNSINIDAWKMKTELLEKIKDKNTEIIFCCNKSVRSVACAEIANNLGYKNIYIYKIWEN